MDSYGEILKSTREEKNLDLDKISRELTIDKRYLVAAVLVADGRVK